MRILVCFKTGPEIEQVVDADWECFSPSAELGYVRKTFGCFDETALETALRLKDSLKERDSGVQCAALTLGNLPVPLCKTLFAAGFDEVFAAPSPAPEFRPQETASALGKFISGGNWDLILTGRQAGYADTGMVPLLLAESLGLPAITEAETVSLLDGDSGLSILAIERSDGSGRERIAVRLPALVVMGNSPVSVLRAVTLAARLQAANRAPAMIPADISRECPEPRFVRELSRKTCRFLDGGANLPQSVRETEEALREWGAL
jgi:electron transfer flavoprotein beta subunit